MARTKASRLFPGLVYEHKVYGNGTPVSPARLERIWTERMIDQHGNPYGVYWGEVTFMETNEVEIIRAHELRRVWKRSPAFA